MLQQLDQYMATHQQLAAEKEPLHKQVQLQTPLIKELQQKEVQGKAEAKMADQELQETQVRDLRSGPLSGKACKPCPFSLSFLALRDV